MHEKIENLHSFIQKYQLDDVRTIGLLVFSFIVLAVTWSGAKAVQLNYALQKRAAGIDQQNQVLELENATQKLKNEYYKTEEFKELEARRVLGKAAPGERVYVIPEQVALSKVKTPTETEPEKEDKELAVVKSKTQQNFEDWMDFFMGRSL